MGGLSAKRNRRRDSPSRLATVSTNDFHVHSCLSNSFQRVMNIYCNQEIVLFEFIIISIVAINYYCCCDKHEGILFELSMQCRAESIATSGVNGNGNKNIKFGKSRSVESRARMGRETGKGKGKGKRTRTGLRAGQEKEGMIRIIIQLQLQLQEGRWQEM